MAVKKNSETMSTLPLRVISVCVSVLLDMVFHLFLLWLVWVVSGIVLFLRRRKRCSVGKEQEPLLLRVSTDRMEFDDGDGR